MAAEGTPPRRQEAEPEPEPEPAIDGASVSSRAPGSPASRRFRFREGAPPFASLCKQALGLEPARVRPHAGTGISPTHHWLFVQGVAYAVFGLLFFALPTAAINWTVEAVGMEAFETNNSTGQELETEVTMMRFTGFLVLLIGWFYVQGARENTLHFVAASSLNRFAIVPVFMLILALLGARWPLCLIFALLDPSLAALTLLSLWGSTCCCALPRCCKCARLRRLFCSTHQQTFDDDPRAFVHEADRGSCWPSAGRLAFLQLMSRAIKLREDEMAGLSCAHRLLVAQGCLYMVVGLAGVFVPEAALAVFTFGTLSASDMGERELTMMQMTGSAVVFIGHFFVQGGRSNTVHFVATTTFNRLFIDPVAMLLLWAMGLHWQLCVLEIALGLSGTALTLAAFYDKICRRNPETPTAAP